MPTLQQLDDNGSVIPHDGGQISREDWVVRQVSSEWIVPDPKFPQGQRLTSVVWEPSSGLNGGLSVNLESLILEQGIRSESFLISQRYPASIKMNLGLIRDYGFLIGFDPINNDAELPDNPCHCQIWGVSTKGKQNQLKNIISRE